MAVVLSSQEIKVAARKEADAVARKFANKWHLEAYKPPIPPEDAVPVHLQRVLVGRIVSFDGASTYDLSEDQLDVYLNTHHGKARRTFTLWHEIGHLFLGHIMPNGQHKTGWVDEVAANQFAAHIQIPTASLRKIAKAWIKETGQKFPETYKGWMGHPYLLCCLATTFGVSHETMFFRLLDLDLIQPLKPFQDAQTEFREYEHAMGLWKPIETHSLADNLQWDPLP